MSTHAEKGGALVPIVHVSEMTLLSDLKGNGQIMNKKIILADFIEVFPGRKEMHQCDLSLLYQQHFDNGK